LLAFPEEGGLRTQPLTEGERRAMTDVLARIERAGAAVAAECGVDVHVESDDRGKFPLVAFRLHGYLPAKNAPAGTVVAPPSQP
jgi:hypothetical protein